MPNGTNGNMNGASAVQMVTPTPNVTQAQKALDTARSTLNRYVRGGDTVRERDRRTLSELMRPATSAASKPNDAPKSGDGSWLYGNTRVTMPDGFDMSDAKSVEAYRNEQNQLIDWMGESETQEEDF